MQDWNVELGIKNHQKSNSFQRLSAWMYFLEEFEQEGKSGPKKWIPKELK